jgi:hypothetical protein
VLKNKKPLAFGQAVFLWVFREGGIFIYDEGLNFFVLRGAWEKDFRFYVKVEKVER